MPTLSKPINIPGPWAYNGDKNTIPDTGADVGLASWAQGWGLVNQLPLTAGGIPPARADFNGALNALSAHVYYQQSGAYYDWSADLMYPFPARVLGSDGKVYDWVSSSGVGTSAGAQDPTTDNDRTWWTPAVTGGDLPEFDGTTIKLINGKYGVPEFTAPTASAPGKAGLVPGPEATPENELLLNLLSAKGFMKIDPSALFPSAESVELNKTTLALGGELVVNLAIDQLRRSGWFAGSFTGTLPAGVSEGILLNLLTYNNSDQLYYRSQLLIAYNNSKIYRRGSHGFAPGGTITSDSQWQELGAFAPIPTLSAGVGQVFVAGYGYHTLPAGGTWYVQTLGITIDQGITTGTAAFLAGGTQVGNPGTGWVLAQCLYA